MTVALIPPDDHPVWHTAIRAGAGVRLHLAPDAASALADHCAPHIRVITGDEAPKDAWTIRTTGTVAPGELIDQPSKNGDIGYRVWLDEVNRVLSVDNENALTQQRRLVRCLLRRAFMERGYFFLHSALVVSQYSGRALALAGGKRAGKTTLMLAMLLSGNFAFATNDDLTVNMDAKSGAEGFGWPRAVGIRRDTLRLLAGRDTPLRQILKSARHPVQERHKGNPVDRRAILFPDELARATGASVVPQAPLGAIIAPRFDSAALTPELELVRDHDEAYQLLLPCMEDRASREEKWLDKYYTRPNRDDLTAQAAQLCEQVPVYRLRQSMACLADSTERLSELAIKESL